MWKVGKGYEVKDDRNNARHVQPVTTVPPEKPCKKCKQKRRKGFSQYCSDCLFQHQTEEVKKQRFQQKVEEARALQKKKQTT